MQNKNVLTFYIVPPFCSLDGCDLSGAAGEAIGAALLTNKTLTDLKYGALLSVLLPYFSAPPLSRTKICLLFTFLPPSLLQLVLQQGDHRSSVDQDRRRCCCQQIAAEARVRCSFFAVCLLYFSAPPRCRTKIAYFLHFSSLLFCSLGYCELSGAAGEAIGAALLTNKSLQNLKYGARSYFASLFL